MPYWLSKTYFALFGGGLLSAILHWKRLLYFRTRIKIKTKTSLAGERATVRLLIFGQHWDRRGLFQNFYGGGYGDPLRLADLVLLRQ